MTFSFPGFSTFFSDTPFVDRFANDPTDSPITIIIPAAHANELWRANLYSIYRETPVYHLLIGDAGLTPDQQSIARQLPRCTLLDHTGLTLGYSIRLMLELVETPLFAYLHSDVFLPPKWFDLMLPASRYLDWYGCPMFQTTFIPSIQDYGPRPFAGAQIGHTSLFRSFSTLIDDDYVWRQEDFVFAHLVESHGGVVGHVDNTFHFHQLMPKVSDIWNPEINVSITASIDRKTTIRAYSSQLLGLLKYTHPRSIWCRVELRVSFEQILRAQPTFFLNNLRLICALLVRRPSWILPFSYAVIRSFFILPFRFLNFVIRRLPLSI